MSTPVQQSFCGKEVTVEAFGQPWTFSRWTLNVLDQFTEFARTVLPNPIDECAAAIERMEQQEEKLQIRDAKVLARRNKIKDVLVENAIKQASSYLAFHSPEVQSLLNSPRGAAHLVSLLLRKHHPDITEEVAFSLVQELAPQMERIMLTTAGKPPPSSSGNGQAPVASSSAGRGD